MILQRGKKKTVVGSYDGYDHFDCSLASDWKELKTKALVKAQELTQALDLKTITYRTVGLGVAKTETISA